MEPLVLPHATMENILITPQIRVKYALLFVSFVLIFQFVHPAHHQTIFSKILVLHLVLMAIIFTLLAVKHALLLVLPVIVQQTVYPVKTIIFCTMETVILHVHHSLLFKIR